jgi:predicted SAM-dependent methyltransferase
MTNLPEHDALNARHWRLLFRPRSLDRIMAEHVVEHWTEERFATFLGIAKTYLAPSGVLRIAVPDGYTPDRDYIERVKPGGSGRGAQDHKMLYTCDTLTAALSRAGFRGDLLE